jgi:hypothetical protein
MQIKLGLPSRDPENPGGGVLDVTYRENRIIQKVPGGMAVDFQNNSAFDRFEVDFDRSNSIECDTRSDRMFWKTGNCAAIRVHNLSGGAIAPTIIFAPIGVRPSGGTRGVLFSPRIERCRYGILTDTGNAVPPIIIRDAEIQASELGAMVPSTGAHRLIDCSMVVHGYRLSDEARIVSAGSDVRDGEWSVFAAGGGHGLAVELRIDEGKLAAAALLAGGQDYLDGRSGEFLLDAPPSTDDGAGSAGVVAVTVEAGTCVDLCVVATGEGYLQGASGSYRPLLPEYARLVATARGGVVVEVKVIHCGWRFYLPPALQLDPAAGGRDVFIAIDLARRSHGAWFAEAEGAEVSGGLYHGAVGAIHYANASVAPADGA